MHFHRQGRPSRSKNPGRQILLEREGIRWEGRGRKELPAWLTQQEEARHEKPSLRECTWRLAAQLLTAVLGMKTS